MRFHVLGVGPIGSLVAFHLRRALPSSYPISLVVRTKRRARELRVGGGIAVEHGGVAVTQEGYDVELFDPLEESAFDLVYNKRGEMRLPEGANRKWRRKGELAPQANIQVQRPIESLIVCTKAHATLPVFERIRHRLTSASTVVLLQNGMGVYDRLVADLFRNPLERPQFILATTTHAARSRSQGEIIHTIHTGDGELSFGIIPDPLAERDFESTTYHRKPDHYHRSLDDIAPAPQDGISKDRCASLRATIAALSSMLDLNPSWDSMSELQIRLKRKLVVNAVINPLTAMAQCSNGALLGNFHARAMTKTISEEAAAVFAAEVESEARELNREEAVRRTREALIGLHSHELEAEVYRILRRTSLNFSSMLQDIWKGQQTEIDYINGHLQRLGAKFGVPTPYNDMLYAMIKMRERIVPAARI